MSGSQAGVWLDDVEARVCRVEPQELASISARRLTGSAGESGQGSAQFQFFEAIVAALKGVDALLVLGASSTRLDFVRHLQQHAKVLESKIVSVEVMAAPSDSKLLAHVRLHFRTLNAKASEPRRD